MIGNWKLVLEAVREGSIGGMFSSEIFEVVKETDRSVQVETVMKTIYGLSKYGYIVKKGKKDHWKGTRWFWGGLKIKVCGRKEKVVMYDPDPVNTMLNDWYKRAFELGRK